MWSLIIDYHSVILMGNNRQVSSHKSRKTNVRLCGAYNSHKLPSYVERKKVSLVFWVAASLYIFVASIQLKANAHVWFFFATSTEPPFWVKLWTLRRVMRPWSAPDTYSITEPHPCIPTPQGRHQLCARARLIASPHMNLLINKLQTTQKHAGGLLFYKNMVQQQRQRSHHSA